MVDLLIDKHGPPLYVRHHIVHNDHVVKRLEGRGAIFVEDIRLVPDGSRVVFSAHGSPPSLYRAAKKRRLQIIDATCPLVAKVHLEAVKFAREEANTVQAAELRTGGAVLGYVFGK